MYTFKRNAVRREHKHSCRMLSLSFSSTQAATEKEPVRHVLNFNAWMLNTPTQPVVQAGIGCGAKTGHSYWWGRPNTENAELGHTGHHAPALLQTQQESALFWNCPCSLNQNKQVVRLEREFASMPHPSQSYMISHRERIPSDLSSGTPSSLGEINIYYRLHS